MGYNVTKKVQDAGLILGGLGVIGFIGIVWLMIYGNLSGNLGFTQDSATYSNETVTFANAGVTPTSAVGLVNPTLSSIIMTNATGGEVVPANNYTTVGALISPAADGTYNGTSVNISYTVAYDSSGKVSTDGVIANVSGGFGTFFGFSGTLFTIAAVVLLIFMLVGLLAIVMQIAKLGRDRKGKMSGY